MKRLMTSTAALIVLGSTSFAVAQDANSPFMQLEADGETQLLASDLLGARIYATESEVGDTMEPGAETEWDDLGEINDMVMSQDGSVEAVILGVGGFLGIGERDVAVTMDGLQVVRDGEDPTDYFLVVNANPDAVENAPEYVRAEQQMDQSTGMSGTGAGTTTGTAGGMGAGSTMTGDSAAQNMNQAGESMEQAGENAAEMTGDAAQDAAQGAENVAGDAANAAQDAANDAANAAEDAAQEAEDATDGNANN